MAVNLDQVTVDDNIALDQLEMDLERFGVAGER